VALFDHGFEMLKAANHLLKQQISLRRVFKETTFEGITDLGKSIVCYSNVPVFGGGNGEVFFLNLVRQLQNTQKVIFSLFMKSGSVFFAPCFSLR